jgi:hypothetical protein
LNSIGSFSLVGFGIRAASQLHNRMVRSLANAKIGFFDAYVTPPLSPPHLFKNYYYFYFIATINRDR